MWPIEFYAKSEVEFVDPVIKWSYKCRFSNQSNSISPSPRQLVVQVRLKIPSIPLLLPKPHMAFSLACSPSPVPKNFLSSTSSTSSSSYFSSHCTCTTRTICKLWTTTRKRKPVSRRIVSTKASENDDDDKPGFNPFGFVTDNPSSRSAIQLPEVPAEDGNVGQMLYVSNPIIFFFFIQDSLFWL